MSYECSDEDAAVQRLCDLAEELGLESEDLDETVHEYQIYHASEVNNQGIDEQLRALLREDGEVNIKVLLNEIAEGKQS